MASKVSESFRLSLPQHASERTIEIGRAGIKWDRGTKVVRFFATLQLCYALMRAHLPTRVGRLLLELPGVSMHGVGIRDIVVLYYRPRLKRTAQLPVLVDPVDYMYRAWSF